MNVIFNSLIPHFILCISLGGINAQTNVFVDPRDRQEYSFVEIGKTDWMVENLKYIHPDLIFTDRMVIDTSGSSGHYYLHNYATQICPDGWKLPTFKQVSEYIRSFEGKEQPERGGKRIPVDLIRNIQMGGYVKIIDSSPIYEAQGYMGIILTQADSLINVVEEDGTQTQNSYAIGLHIYPVDTNKDWYNIEPTFDAEQTTFYNCRCVRSLEIK